MKEKEIIEILKSGNFTIYYHDNGESVIYKGKYTMSFLEKLQDDKFDKFEDENKIFDSSSDGYYTQDLELLVKALGGKLLCV